jgi:hypothetical protein
MHVCMFNMGRQVCKNVIMKHEDHSTGSIDFSMSNCSKLFFFQGRQLRTVKGLHTFTVPERRVCEQQVRPVLTRDMLIQLCVIVYFIAVSVHVWNRKYQATVIAKTSAQMQCFT